MSSFEPNLWDTLGILLAGVAGYFVVTRTLLPQFAMPWFGKRDRQRAINRIDQLMVEPDLNDQERNSLRRCRNTLLAYDSGHREAWSGSLPISEVVKEVDVIWEERCAPRE